MKQLKPTLTATIALLPFFAFAHGQEILLPTLIQLISILVFIVLLVPSKINVPGKVLLGTTYFITLGLLVFFPWNVSYVQNRILLDFIMALGPAIITLAVFLLVKLRKRDKG